MLIIETAKRLTEIKNNLVVVGSTALLIRGLIERAPKDLDIVVDDLSGLEGYSITPYVTRSVFSPSGNRAFISAEQTGFIFDIFVESVPPESEIINGVRVVTIEAALRYYRSILSVVDEPFKENIKNLINIYHG